ELGFAGVADAEFIGRHSMARSSFRVKHEIPDVAASEDTVFHCCSPGGHPARRAASRLASMASASTPTRRLAHRITRPTLKLKSRPSRRQFLSSHSLPSPFLWEDSHHQSFA